MPRVELRDCGYSSNQSLHRTIRVTFWFDTFHSWAAFSPLVRSLCLALIFLDMLWDAINFLSTLSFLYFSANRAWLFQENPLAYLLLSWPNLTVISQEISNMYFIPFTGNASTYSHFFLLRLGSKVPCFEIPWPALSLIICLSSPLCKELHYLTDAYVLLCSYCCYHSNLSLNINLIMIIFSPFPIALGLKHTVPMEAPTPFVPQGASCSSGLTMILNSFLPLYQPGVSFFIHVNM